MGIYPPVKTNGVDELRTVLMLSQVVVLESEAEVSEACDEKYILNKDTASGCVVGVRKASGKKCERCWFYDESIGTSSLPHSDVCQRCNEAISSWEAMTGKIFTRPKVKLSETAS